MNMLDNSIWIEADLNYTTDISVWTAEHFDLKDGATVTSYAIRGRGRMERYGI